MKMTPKEKAEELRSKYTCEPSCHANDEFGRYCAKICVTEITSALEECGEFTDELQNMDRTFAYWDSVYEEI